MRDDELLTVAEVVSRLRLSRTTVYDLIRTHRLVSIRVGRARRIPVQSVRDFIAGELREAA
ncbi:helix-turn-helix domain-containing protein [Streptomyces sp. NPDC001985]|uniref:helix-turn-helix domain-containing protein n=1 Tax=Streptomyces sp. NPDC001985 TaxID=3154406 RepID=UPI0033297F55